MIYFLTGNSDKLEEAKSIVGNNVEGVDIDLPEIQEIDARKIIDNKLTSAFHHHPGPFIVEDTSLYLDALPGLPGPLIKWFLRSIGIEGIYDLARRYNNYKARAVSLIGYAKVNKTIKFFEGVIEGEIVIPKGDKGFGWDPIFKPSGETMTFAEMDTTRKNSISMRRLALEEFKKYLIH